MEKFKSNWEITENWQLLFPILGLFGLGYSAYKLSNVIVGSYGLAVTIMFSAIVFTILLKVTLWLFKVLAKRWILQYRWEMIRVFIVFAITGSSSMLVGRPLMKLVGIDKDILNPILYWVLFIIIGLFLYQILLVTFGWLFGQFQFFWEFEKKMLSKMGFKRFLK